MTDSEPKRTVVIDGHSGIESGFMIAVPMAAHQYGGAHEVVVSAAAIGPWDDLIGQCTTEKPKKIVVIGATGTIGSAVANALESTHRIVRASRHGPVKVDIGDPASIAALFESVSDIDAIVCCAASVKPVPLMSLSEGHIAHALEAKLTGQVNLVRGALRHLRDGGSVTLTAGTRARAMPGPGLDSLVNAGLRGFVKAVASEMPRGLRVNVVSSTWVRETLERLGLDSAGTIAARDVARAYVVAVEGMLQGQTIVPTAL